MPNIGLGLVVGFSEEAAWGTVEATVDNFIDAEGGSAVFRAMREHIQGEELLYRGILSSSVDKGMIEGEGSLSFPLRYGGGWPLFVSQLNGVDPTTAGTGPYTHTQNLGVSLAAANNLAKGISVYVDREGMTGGGSSKASAYTGFKPASCEFVFEQNQRARLNVEGVFEQLDSFVTRPTATLSARPFVVSPSPNSSPTAFLTWNAVAYVVKSCSYKFEQEWEIRRDMQSALMLQPVPGSLLKVSGSFTCEAPATGAASGGAFYDDYLAKTMRQLVITADGPDANSKLVLTVTKALITANPEPEVSGPGVVSTSVEWEGFYDASTSRIAQQVLTSSDSAAWA